MRIFFITFVFIATISLYPKVAPLFLESDDTPVYISDPVAIAQENGEDDTKNSYSENNTQNTKQSATMRTNTGMHHAVRKIHSIQMPMYKNGEYNGDVKDAYYGNVQVKVIIQKNKISNIKFLKFPKNNQNSLYLSHMSLPSLKKEVIRAQNEKVDMISGATYTSTAFIQSTKTALLKALN